MPPRLTQRLRRRCRPTAKACRKKSRRKACGWCGFRRVGSRPKHRWPWPSDWRRKRALITQAANASSWMPSAAFRSAGRPSLWRCWRKDRGLLRLCCDRQLQYRVLQKHQAHRQQADAFSHLHRLEQVIEVRGVEAVFLDIFEIEGTQVDVDIIERLIDQRVGQHLVNHIGLGLAHTVLLGLSFSPLGAFLLFVWGSHIGEFLVRYSHVHGTGMMVGKLYSVLVACGCKGTISLWRRATALIRLTPATP